MIGRVPMQKFISFIYLHASLANLVLAIMLVIPFNALIFPLMSGHFHQIASGMSTLDVQLGYTPSDAARQTASYGASARQYYLLIEWTADLFYPIVYSSVFTLLLGFILKGILQEGHRFRGMVVAPSLMMISDYLENIFISLQILVYPTTISILGWLSAFFSLLKWFLGGIIIVSLLISVIFLIKNLTGAVGGQGSS